MARPKKEQGAAETITVSKAGYIQMANFLAGMLQNQRENANRQLSIASSNLSAANQLLGVLKTHTTMIIDSNDVKFDPSVEDYQHIQRLLSAENVEELATAGLPEAKPPTDTKAVKPKKQRKERDPNAPKRPLTAFFLFLQDKRDETTEQMKKSDPGFKPGDVQKRNTERWNALSEEEQLPYKKKYEANMEKYKEDIAAYKAQGGKVELDDELHMEEDDQGPPTDPALEAPKSPAEEDEEVEDEAEEAAPANPEVGESSSSDESDEPSPPPRKETKKASGKAAKEASPEKKKKAAKEETKKAKKGKEPSKEPSKSASPELPKKKRKADDKDATKPEKKKKQARKSQGYNGNDEDF